MLLSRSDCLLSLFSRSVIGCRILRIFFFGEKLDEAASLKMVGMGFILLSQWLADDFLATPY
jgi:hypothetical protein